MIHKYLIPVLAVGALVFAILFMVNSHRADPPHPPYQQPPAKSSTTGLAGAGIIEPVNQNKAIGSPLSGIVIWVIEQKQVGKDLKAGDPLFKLDDRAQKADIAVKKAALFAAELQLKRLKMQPRPEEVPPQEERVKELTEAVKDQEAQWELTRQAWNRRPKGVSLDEYNKRKFALSVARAQLEKAKKDLALLQRGAWEADLAVQEAAVTQARAQLEQSQTDLDRLTVRAPIDCQLVQVNVHEGEFVGAQFGQTLILLGNLKETHVRVDIDEHDVGRFREGMPARAYVRGRTDYPYELEFYRAEAYITPKKSLTGDNSERVDSRVLQVIYKFKSTPDLAHKVYIGQQMDVFFGKGK
jgi:multidrug efflux pump subunit AcrA (membrane-fusion protein)